MPTRALDASAAIMDQLRRLEQRERRQRRSEGFRGQYEFKVSPTCPPSTAIHIRGGRAWNPTDSNYPGRGWTVPHLTWDFAEPETGSGWTWDNAYWYLGTTVALAYGYNPDYQLEVAAGDMDTILWLVNWDPPHERATAAEAEDDALGILWHPGSRPWEWTIPLCMIILRNNGIVGEHNAGFAPIDAVNRGRSYIFQDCRPRGLWVIGDI